MWMDRSWLIRCAVVKARIRTAAIREAAIMGIRLCARKFPMSSIPQKKTDIRQCDWLVRFGPKSELTAGVGRLSPRRLLFVRS